MGDTAAGTTGDDPTIGELVCAMRHIATHDPGAAEALAAYSALVASGAEPLHHLRLLAGDPKPLERWDWAGLTAWCRRQDRHAAS